MSNLEGNTLPFFNYAKKIHIYKKEDSFTVMIVKKMESVKVDIYQFILKRSNLYKENNKN